MFLWFIGEFGMLSRRLKDGKGAKMNSGEDLLEALSHIIHPQISQVGSVGGRQRRLSNVWSASVRRQNVHHGADFEFSSL